MPLDPTHQECIRQAVRLGEAFADHCPQIAPILREELNKIKRLMEEERLIVSTEGLDAPEDPGGTRNEGWLWWKKKVTYINPRLFPQGIEPPYDTLRCVTYQKMIRLLATLLHEMFHQNCVPHPYAYDATAGLLIAMADCARNHWTDAWCNPTTEDALRAEADNEASNRGGTAQTDWKAVSEAVAAGAGAGALLAIILKSAAAGTVLAGPLGAVIGALVGVIFGGIVYFTSNPC